MDEVRQTLLSEDQFALSSGIIGKYLSDPLVITQISTKNSSISNLTEYQITSILPRSNSYKGVLTKSGSVEIMKSSIDLSRFLIPTLSLSFIQKTKHEESESEKRLTKSRQNDFVGRGKTSYRLRPQHLFLEESIVGNTVFNRTHYLLMFGALGSMTVPSDDEDGTEEYVAQGTRFNPCGNKLDTLADEDNCTDYDLVTMAKYPGTYSSSQQQIVMNFRLKFLHSLRETIRQFTEIPLKFDFDFHLSPEKFEFHPFDYSDFNLVISILTNLSRNSTSFRDFEQTSRLFITFLDFIKLGITYPNAKVHFVCGETLLIYIYILHLFIVNLSYGMRLSPYSLFDLLSRLQIYGFNSLFSEIEAESTILSKQLDIGGLYCLDLKEFQSLSVAASINNFRGLLTIANDCLMNGHDTAADIAVATSLCGSLYSIRISVLQPHSILINFSSFHRKAKYKSVFPLWNMHDNANKYASDTNEIIFLPW